jgi:transketolase
MNTTVNPMKTRHLTELAQQLRVDSVRAAAAAGSGHPTSSMSAADLMAVLLAKHMHYDFERPQHHGNDRFVLSKGHASPLLYAAYRAAGAISEAELLTFRKLGSRLEGHPTPRRLPWVETATGSLGQGLPVGVGIALAGKRLDHTGYRVWVLCGDSELAEGSVWEGAEYAGYEHLDNLVAIIDVNRLGQRGPTRHGHDLDAYARRFQAFGWHTVEIDGHDVEAIDRAYAEAESTAGPRGPARQAAAGRRGGDRRTRRSAQPARGGPTAASGKGVARRPLRPPRTAPLRHRGQGRHPRRLRTGARRARHRPR